MKGEGMMGHDELIRKEIWIQKAEEIMGLSDDEARNEEYSTVEED